MKESRAKRDGLKKSVSVRRNHLATNPNPMLDAGCAFRELADFDFS
jgi:hypothetical protein